MDFKAPFRIEACLLWLCMFAAGCQTVRFPIDDPNLNDVTIRLDNIEKRVEEWGATSTSRMLLLPDTGQFTLEYNEPVAEYVARARNAYQGAARRSLEFSEVEQSAQRTITDAKQVAQGAGGPLGSLLSGVASGALANAAIDPSLEATGDEGEVEPSLPAFKPILPMANPAESVLSSPTFTAPLPLAAPPSAVSERQAMMIGVNDKVTENILKLITHPIPLSDNQELYIGLMQVSCNPGWRTRRGYIAEVHVTPEYVNDSAEFTQDPYYRNGESAPAPTILSVFPLLEAQTLDLRNSEREQKSLLTYISALALAQGSSVQSEDLKASARRLETDASTFSPIPLVSSFSNGYSFGFQFMPAFQALADPSDKKEGARQVLHPFSFPAVVFVVCDSNEIKPDSPDGYDEIAFHVSTRWIPLKKDRPKFFSRPMLPRDGIIAQVGIAAEFDRALKSYRTFVDAAPKPDIANHFLRYEIDRRVRAIESLGLGTSNVIPIPRSSAAGLPTIDTVIPTTGWSNATTVLSIQGANFTEGKQSIVKAVAVAGRHCEFKVTGKNTLLVEVAPWTIGGSIDQEHAVRGTVLITTTKGAVESTTKIEFSQKLGIPTPNPAATVIRDDKGQPVRLEVNRDGVKGKELLDAGTAMVGKEKAAGGGNGEPNKPKEEKVVVSNSKSSKTSETKPGGDGAASSLVETTSATSTVSESTRPIAQEKKPSDE